MILASEYHDIIFIDLIQLHAYNYCPIRIWLHNIHNFDTAMIEIFNTDLSFIFLKPFVDILKFNSFESYYYLLSYLLFTYISMVKIKVPATLTFFHIQRISWTVCNFSRLSKFWASTGNFFIFIGTILSWHFDRCNCKRYKFDNKD